MRNQSIAVRDYLKQKIHNLNEYSIKYQHRQIMELLEASKKVKEERIITGAQKLHEVAEMTVNTTMT